MVLTLSPDGFTDPAVSCTVVSSGEVPSEVSLVDDSTTVSLVGSSAASIFSLDGVSYSVSLDDSCAFSSSDRFSYAA